MDTDLNLSSMNASVNGEHNDISPNSVASCTCELWPIYWVPAILFSA